MSRCTHCGVTNEPNRLRCATCGAPSFVPSRAATITRTVPRDTPRDTLRVTRESLERSATELSPKPSAKTRIPATAHEAAGAWLIAEVLDKPYPIHRACAVNLGRGSENHVVLPVQQVSRHHATIQWSGDGFDVIDHGSMNGTRVNGEIVSRRRLAESDTIRIGPVEFIFATQVLESVPKGGDTDTAHDWGPVVSQSSFAGVLTHLRLQDVWQMLELGRKTGRLLVQNATKRGAVYFGEGRALHAELGTLVGEGAALALLLLDAGTFRFLPSARIDVSPTIHRPSTCLLLEAARISDEESRETA